MMQDYMDITGDTFSEMRVLIEGAISLSTKTTPAALANLPLIQDSRMQGVQ